MFFKVVLLIVTTFITDLKILAFTLISCFYCYLFAIRRLKPYRQDALQDNMPLVVSSYITTVFVTYYYKDNNYPLLKYASAAILGVLNLFTIGCLVFHTVVIIRLQRRVQKDNKERKKKHLKIEGDPEEQAADSPQLSQLDIETEKSFRMYDEKFNDVDQRRISVEFKKVPTSKTRSASIATAPEVDDSVRNRLKTSVK